MSAESHKYQIPLIDLFYPHGHNGGMRSYFYSIIYTAFLVILSGCAVFRLSTPPASKEPRTTQPKQASKKPSPEIMETGAVWELLETPKLTLQLKNVDNENYLSVIIENGLSIIEIPKGHWELTGFEEEGTSYLSMNISKKFVFRMNPKINTYAGSIIIGCPKISPLSFKLLKQMKYFNRYPFSSSKGLCELVVGNDYFNVRTQLRKLQKSKRLPLAIGF